MQSGSNILAELIKRVNHDRSEKQYACSELYQRHAALQMAKATLSSEYNGICLSGYVVSDTSRELKFPGVKIVTAIAHALLFRTVD